MTFWRLVCSAAETMPERVILADDYGRSLTATQFRDTAERVAAGLDVAPGEVVSWQLPTTLEAAILMAALSRLDVVQNPVISVLRQREVRIITTQEATPKGLAQIAPTVTLLAEAEGLKGHAASVRLRLKK